MSQTTFNFLFGLMIILGLVGQVFAIYGMLVVASNVSRTIRGALESPKLAERTNRLARFAEQARLSFLAEADPAFVKGLPFQLFQRTRTKLRLPGVYRAEPVRNVFQWRADGADFLLFDYVYRIGKGTPVTQTVCLIASPQLRLPRFKLRPELRIEEPLEKLLPMLAAIVPTKDIDFEHAPEFSRANFLSGPDEDSTRRVFDDGLIGCLSSFGHRYIIEGEGSRFVIYRSGIALNEQEIVAFVDDAGKVYHALLDYAASDGQKRATATTQA
jgi:hypothetical protein